MSTIIVLDGNKSFGDHPLVTRLLKGVFNTKPALPKYKIVWNVNSVLDYLKTLHPPKSLSLKDLSLKLTMLLALLSGQRCQTLHALNMKDMFITENKVEFVISDLLKTTKPGKPRTKLEFQSYDKDPSLCVVRYLSEYLNRTSDKRKDQKLLISYQKPHKAISKDTVGRWLKMVLKCAGIDTAIFGAHSTRAASTSAAEAHKVPITTIMEGAGWSSENTFMKFYKKPIMETKGNFGKDLLEALNR